MTRLLAVGMVLLSGCSALTMRGAVPSDGTTYPICSDRIAPIVVDSLASAAAGWVTVNSAKEGDGSMAVGMGTGATMLAASAVYGIVTGNRCRASRERYVVPQPAYRFDADRGQSTPDAPPPAEHFP